MRNVQSNAQSPSINRSDASYSRTYLRRKDYHGPRLLRTIRGRPTTSNTFTTDTPIAAQEGNMNHADDADIYGPPISSDENEESPASVKSRLSIPSSTKRKAEETEATPPPKKRVRDGLRTRRASKKSNGSPKFEPEAAPAPSSSIPDFLEFGSQASQQRKRKAQYGGKANAYAPTSSQEASFADPGGVPSTPRKSQGGSFKTLEKTPKSRKRTPSNKLKNLDSPPSVAKSNEKAILFKMPDQLNMLESSSISTDLSNGFDNIESPKDMTRKRSSSTSSLSSIDSMASYQLNQKQKDELGSSFATSEPVPAGSVRCPLCQHIVKLPKKSKQIDPHELSLRKQQIFCHQHRVDDAQLEWRQNGYPTIDWNNLEEKRIAKYTSHLRQILYRKTSSFYLGSLETKLAEARGNQSRIRRYLANDVVEIVKPGYYGPKGAKIMGNKITSEMTSHLKRSLKADKTVQVAGVSGYVSAVLLPELLQRIVMEDMKLQTEEEARKVISDSTEVGMLLWPDDDHVVREDDG